MRSADENPKKSQHEKGQSPSPTYIILEYYQRPFALLHSDPAFDDSDSFLPHPIRKSYWQFIQPGIYSTALAREYLKGYISAVESHLKNYLKNLSIAYCIHLYRRLSPGPIGKNNQPATISLTRGILEAAIQKYATFQLCDKIAHSAEVSIDKVLGGLLMSPEFENERKALKEADQLVLTNFTISDLIDFYNSEKLAYEIWKASAVLRAFGKGAPLFVDNHHDEYFGDARSDELDSLLKSYDSRIGGSGVSETSSGVVYTDWREDSIGCVMLPVYNIGKETARDLKDYFSKALKVNINDDFTPNFLWVPMNLRQYRIAHAPFAQAFYQKHNVTLDSVLAIITALSLRVLGQWHHTPWAFMRDFQRAYTVTDSALFKEGLIELLPYACQTLGLDESVITESDFIDALSFWTLNEFKRDEIDLAYSGPHYPFLPIQTENMFINYAWIIRRLFDLFYQVPLNSQHFKGEALEKLINQGTSALPTKPCKLLNGEQKQIDYAHAFHSYLIIAECKAVNMSIGFDRGDPKAIKFRTENVVERALTEVDDKASWLAKHPNGSNYNLEDYTHIIPIAISPFVEFIPSKDRRYWLTNDIPRVLTPREFKDFLEEPPAVADVFNSVSIPWPSTPLS